jgi:hypothetical protein
MKIFTKIEFVIGVNLIGEYFTRVESKFNHIHIFNSLEFTDSMLVGLNKLAAKKYWL